VSVARALWITGPGRAELREELLPVLGVADVEVRAEFSAVSRGTETLVLAGGVPESQHDVMRAPFQAGEFPYPVKYGYLSVGTVVHAGARAQDLVGRAVFCLHPHQDRYVVPASAVLPVPAGVPTGRAVLAGMLETAVNGVWDAGVGIGDRVSVVVLHTSGTGAGLTTGLGLLGSEGLLAELSWYGDRSVEVGLGEGFHSRRLTIRASQVGRVPPARAPRWTTRRRLALALDLLADDRFDVLLDGETPFDEAATVLPAVAAPGGDALCHRFRY
jgi:hypothetical protein